MGQIIALLLVCALAGSLFAKSADKKVVLTKVTQVRRLSQLEAAQSVPLQLSGVITAFSGYKNSFFVQDDTAGISVDRTDHAEVKLGDRVLIAGTSGAGMFAPLVLASFVQVVGPAPPPPSRRVSYGDMFGGTEDSQRIELEGIVHSAQIGDLFGHPVLLLAMQTGEGSVKLLFQDFAAFDFARLIDSTVRVRGVCSTAFNQNRQFVGIGLFVPHRQDLDIMRLAAAEPFAAAAKPIRDVLQFGESRHRVKVAGIASYQIPGRALYLQDKGGGIRIESESKEIVAPGSRIEAAGFPVMGDYAPLLENGSFRNLGPAAPVVPRRITAGDVITLGTGFYQAPYDQQVVQLKGSVVDSRIEAGKRVLILRGDRVVFEAELPTSKVHDGIADIGTALSNNGNLCHTWRP